MAQKPIPFEPRGQRPQKPKKNKGRSVPFEPSRSKIKDNPFGKSAGDKIRELKDNHANNKKGVDPKYRNSSFNPFGNHPGGITPGARIKRGADNKPNEGDSDWDPRRHGKASVKAAKLAQRVAKFKRSK